MSPHPQLLRKKMQMLTMALKLLVPAPSPPWGRIEVLNRASRWKYAGTWGKIYSLTIRPNQPTDGTAAARAQARCEKFTVEAPITTAATRLWNGWRGPQKAIRTAITNKVNGDASVARIHTRAFYSLLCFFSRSDPASTGMMGSANDTMWWTLDIGERKAWTEATKIELGLCNRTLLG